MVVRQTANTTEERGYIVLGGWCLHNVLFQAVLFSFPEYNETTVAGADC